MSKKLAEIEARLKAIKVQLTKTEKPPTPPPAPKAPNPWRQPTDEEVTAHLVAQGFAANNEELKKKDEQWGNGINNFFKEVSKPVEAQSPNKLAKFGRGPIEQEVMTEEEKRISQIPVDPSLLNGD